MRRRGRRVARLPAVIPRPASTLDQMAIWYVASRVKDLVSFVRALALFSGESVHTEEIGVVESVDEGHTDDNRR